MSVPIETIALLVGNVSKFSRPSRGPANQNSEVQRYYQSLEMRRQEQAQQQYSAGQNYYQQVSPAHTPRQPVPTYGAQYPHAQGTASSYSVDSRSSRSGNYSDSSRTRYSNNSYASSDNRDNVNSNNVNVTMNVHAGAHVNVIIDKPKRSFNFSRRSKTGSRRDGGGGNFASQLGQGVAQGAVSAVAAKVGL